ncbi:LON peptidase substrate-binding domain-containing protein [Ancylobacter sp. 6x-1]|uniref:LON peptidase substrate-binding domain-containing protein n=1 Tax=Ancylobacter crimeensis TaxID=2579147 RepID=A0ABT0DD19_9HYPH|nr:LON peptidase substrate-binding domain-containing protein [Ancylobacter crimeensis]MCK0197860.1 LON peptidase substrate-binding domain-containing protein [Ancylobacter crimeensis]
MPINHPYAGPDELPELIPLFPLDGALLLPRCQLPLNIFEPRYMEMVDRALAGARLIGMIQTDAKGVGLGDPHLAPVGCVGRITEIAETGNGRYVMNLTGVARFRLVREVPSENAFRVGAVDFGGFTDDFVPDRGADAVDRSAVLRTLADYLEANTLEADWDNIKSTPNEALVNGLAMMAPFGVREKQALLEAPDLRSRADILIAVTEMSLVRATAEGGDAPLQ